MTRYRVKKAQVTIEYAMLAVCIVTALLTMQYYIKRAAQGRLREAADSIGGQYDPRHIDSQITFTQSGTTVIESKQVREVSDKAEEGSVDGVRTTTNTQNEVIERKGYENLPALQNKLSD